MSSIDAGSERDARPGVTIEPGPATVRPPAAVSADSRLAVDIRGLVEQGRMEEARARFAELVTAHPRRASRIA